MKLLLNFGWPIEFRMIIELEREFNSKHFNAITNYTTAYGFGYDFRNYSFNGFYSTKELDYATPDLKYSENRNDIEEICCGKIMYELKKEYFKEYLLPFSKLIYIRNTNKVYLPILVRFFDGDPWEPDIQKYDVVSVQYIEEINKLQLLHEHDRDLMHWAAKNNEFNVIQYMIEKNKNIDYTLSWACQKGYLNVVRYLIEEHDAKLNIKENTTLASESNHDEIVNYLQTRFDPIV